MYGIRDLFTCNILVVIIQCRMDQWNVLWLARIQSVAKTARAGGVAIGKWHACVGVADDAVKGTLIQAGVLLDVKVAALFTKGGVRDLSKQILVRCWDRMLKK